MDRTAYIDYVYQVIESQQPSNQLITAAKLGLDLRRTAGGARWVDYGFSTLKELLQEMERLGLLRIGETDRGALAVQVENKEQLPLGHSPTTDKNPPKSNLRLRQEIWSAFVIEEPRGKRFLNRSTREVRIGLREAPEPVDDWLRVVPISSDVQRAWAQEFLRDRDLISNLPIVNSLTPNEWYRSFPEALRDHAPKLGFEWNRHRSSLVAAEVRRWCGENNLDSEIAFQREIGRERLKRFPTALGHGVIWDEELQRLIVLEALASAPSDWLLDLSIPSKYIFRALAQHSGHSK